MPLLADWRTDLGYANLLINDPQIEKHACRPNFQYGHTIRDNTRCKPKSWAESLTGDLIRGIYLLLLVANASSSCQVGSLTLSPTQEGRIVVSCA
jgi:hypothetical protein